MSRVSEITMGGITFEADYDELLNELLNDSDYQLVETVSDHFYWLVALQWLDAEEIDKERFWVQFNSEGKYLARLRAVRGNMVVKNKTALEILEQADSNFRKLERSGSYDRDSLAVFGARILTLIKDNDQKSFANISLILKNGYVSRGSVGGEGSNYWNFLDAFVRCHIDAKFQLPTKKAIRERLGIPQDADLRRDADKHLEHLGLGGLPPS